MMRSVRKREKRKKERGKKMERYFREEQRGNKRGAWERKGERESRCFQSPTSISETLKHFRDHPPWLLSDPGNL